MAKETTIIFVYDTQLLKREEDDPNSAILYFYPTWVSDQQKISLCGQLMGTITCVRSVFSLPKIVSLQTGKFSIIENGRYILAVGTDRNVPNWILEHRANLIYSFVIFFHKSFVDLSLIFENERLINKLYHIFDTYLKILFFGGNIFTHNHLLQFPKSCNTVYNEFVTFLENCRELPNVLGGALLYHNKVVATQLSTQTTKTLVLTDPHRIKIPAEILETDFTLPIGIQLLKVYITNKEFCELLETSLQCQYIFQYLKNKSVKKSYLLKKFSSESSDATHVKKDSSLLFTSVPEEDVATSVTKVSNVSYENGVMPKISRPKFLNLKSISIESSESQYRLKATPLTPFYGHSSIASTPVLEFKKFVLEKPVKLFKGDLDEEPSDSDENLRKTENYSEPNRGKLTNKAKAHIKQRYSFNDLSGVLNSISKNPSQYLNLKDTFLFSPKKSNKLKRSKTIHDPCYPIFKLDGAAASHNSLKECLQNGIGEDFLRKIDYGNEKTDLSNKGNKLFRRSLTLPLKPNEIQKRERRYSTGVQLTPLMNKLTMLAVEEQFYSGKGLVMKAPYGVNLYKDDFKLNFKITEKKQAEGEEMLQKCALFITGQKDLVLTLLLKEECSRDQETIVKLQELCTQRLTLLEKQLTIAFESQNSTAADLSQSRQYSFLCLDPKWDLVKREGPWHLPDENILHNMHEAFMQEKDISEILLRNPESVIYAYRHGTLEMFYHEDALKASGLLPPSDVLGTVQSIAKKRLEGDQSFTLL